MFYFSKIKSYIDVEVTENGTCRKLTFLIVVYVEYGTCAYIIARIVPHNAKPAYCIDVEFFQIVIMGGRLFFQNVTHAVLVRQP